MFASGYTPDPAWLSQAVNGDADLVAWNDFQFQNTLGVPDNSMGGGGFQPGFLRLGTVFIDVGSALSVGQPVLTFFDSTFTFVIGPGSTQPLPEIPILLVPEPSVALLLGLALLGLVSSSRGRS